MNTLRTALPPRVVAAAFRAAAQPALYLSRVKVGIDRESVDSRCGRDRVVQLTEDMFRRVNRANYGAAACGLRFRGGLGTPSSTMASADQIRKPHPDHDYSVVMDGYKSDPRETGGGWYGDDPDHLPFARTHNDRFFNSPFEKNAIDGINPRKFGHARGVPDIYAMKVDADKNPRQRTGVFRRAVHHELSLWRRALSDYAVRMINHAADRNVDIDDRVAGVLPDRIRVEVADAASPASAAVLSRAVVHPYGDRRAVVEAATDRRGRCTVPVARIFEPEQEFGVRYCNCLVEAEYGGVKAYGWLPLYELQNARFAGQREHTLRLRLKRGCGLVRAVGIDE